MRIRVIGWLFLLSLWCLPFVRTSSFCLSPSSSRFNFQILGYYGYAGFAIGPYHANDSGCCWDSLEYDQVVFRLTSLDMNAVFLTQLLIWNEVTTEVGPWNFSGPQQVPPPVSHLSFNETYDFLVKMPFRNMGRVGLAIFTSNDTFRLFQSFGTLSKLPTWPLPLPSSVFAPVGFLPLSLIICFVLIIYSRRISQ